MGHSVPDYFATLVHRNFVTREVKRWFHIPVYQDDREIQDVVIRALIGQYGHHTTSTFEDGAPSWDQLSDSQKNFFQPHSWYEMFEDGDPAICSSLESSICKGKYLERDRS
jgi:hypothetical protein